MIVAYMLIVVTIADSHDSGVFAMMLHCENSSSSNSSSNRTCGYV
jgi:hypothetical protein